MHFPFLVVIKIGLRIVDSVLEIQRRNYVVKYL